MKTVADLARGWLSKAESDLATARTIQAGLGPYDSACFHCQQAAERYMKGFLSWHRQSFPFTHDLGRLVPLCESVEPSLKLASPDVLGLTDYAVKLRYDNEFWPTKEETAEALAVVERVRGEILDRVPQEVHP